jgi:hypothetical protein
MSAPEAGRYVIQRTGLGGVSPWGIWDGWLHDWCTLANGAERIPLEWAKREQAQHWLLTCRMAWVWDQVPAPEGAGAVLRERVQHDERGERVMVDVYE